MVKDHLSSAEVQFLIEDGSLLAYLTLVDVVHLLDAGQYDEARNLAVYETETMLTLAQTAVRPRRPARE